MVLVFLILGWLIFIVTQKICPDIDMWQSDNAKKSAFFSVLAVTSGFALTHFLFPMIPIENTTTNQLIIGQLLISTTLLMPVVLVVFLMKEPVSSLGVHRKNLLPSFGIGLFLCLISVYHARIDMDFILDKIGALPLYLIIGFVEEIIFRGYLQSRLIAYLGNMKGWLFTTFFFALIHIPQNYYINGQDLNVSFINSMWLLPISGLLGYVMLRTGNIVAPGLFHAFINWSSKASIA